MRTNFHTHTYRCKHAGGTEADYAEEAIKKGLSILGFSDHAPYPDDRFGLRMDFADLEPYINTVNELKDSKKQELIIYSGLEIEYDPKEESYYESLLNDYKLDYLALAQHFYIDHTGEAINIYSAKETSHYVEYAKSIVQGMKTGYFRFLAHPDLMFVNNLAWDDNCEKACNLIVDAALRDNFIIEFNANGYRRGVHDFVDGKRLMYPHKNFWEKVSATSIPVVIGSDCHGPGQVWDKVMEEAHEKARNLGLNVIEDIFNP